ncbi:MAG: DUF2634 domain-containing protein [Oscillibacter sp.]|nr:DUF2634 domain-containing protein [Oscillibacter sp.]
MAGTLFPVIEVPEIAIPGQSVNRPYSSSVSFDFEKGDFVRDGAYRMTSSSGLETYMQWCRKVCLTERDRFLSYSTDIGIESESSLSQADRAAVESALERTITEALMVNVHTEYVRNFIFKWGADTLEVEFTVKAKQWAENAVRASYDI